MHTRRDRPRGGLAGYQGGSDCVRITDPYFFLTMYVMFKPETQKRVKVLRAAIKSMTAIGQEWVGGGM